MAGWKSTTGSALVKVILGTFLVAVIGDLIAGYYADVREASKLKQDLGTQVMTLSAEEADNLTVQAVDLAPQSQLVMRCFDDPPQLPEVAQPIEDTCHTAVFESILQEQELYLSVRATHLQAKVLHQRLETTLEQDEAADVYGHLITGLEYLRRLNSSTSCGASREELAEWLVSTYAWVDDELKQQLVGPEDSTGRCDAHGAAYQVAATKVAEGLAFEGEVVSAKMAVADVEGVTDTRAQLFESIVRDPIVWVLAALGVFLLVWSRRRSSE